MTNINNRPRRSILSTILYILACVFVLILIAGFIMPKNIKMSKTFTVESPNSRYAFNIANNMKSIPSWNAWVKSDTTTKLTYGEIVSGRDASYSWTSKENGDGTMTYSQVIPNEKIDADLVMQGEKSKSTQLFKEENGKTVLTWDFETTMSYPKNVFAPFLKYIINGKNKESVKYMEEEIKKREKGSYYGYEVKQALQNQRYFVTSRSNVAFNQISQFYSQNLSAIYQKLQASGITASGAPCAIYYKYDEATKSTDMAVAVPVLTPVAVKDLTSETFPTQNVATVDFYGDFTNNQMAHYALNDYISDRKLTETHPVLEEYVTDPIKEKDPSKWLTKIYYYIADKR